MRYLLAIAPASPEERTLFRSRPALEALALPLAQNLAALPGARLLVHTTEPRVRELLAGLAEAVLCQPLAGPEQLPLSRHAPLALRAFLDAGHLAGDEPVILADFRNLRLEPGTLLELEAALAREPEARRASFAPVRDHPAQYRALYRLRSLEVYAFPEDPATADALAARLGLGGRWAATRPFFFDWRALGQWDDGERCFLCRLDQANSAVNLQPWQGHAQDLRPGDLLFFRQGPGAARRLAPADQAPQTLAAPTPPMAGSAWPVYAPGPLLDLLDMEPGQRAGLVRWRMRDGGPGSGLLCLWPLSGGGFGERLEQRFEAGPGERAGELDCSPAPDGLLACVLADAHDGPYDFSLPLDGRALWSIDPANGRARHPVTGRFLNNRQEFPALHERDWSLTAGRAAGLLEPDKGEDEGTWLSVPLKPGEAAKVCDRLSLALETGLRLPSAPPDTDGAAETALPEQPSGPYLEFPEFSAALAGGGSAEDLAAARVALARLVLRVQQLQWLAQRGPAVASRDRLLNWLLFERGNEYSFAVAHRLFEAEIRAHRGLATAAPDRERLAAAPGPGFPGRSLGLGSDGRDRVFVCTSEGGRPGELRVKELAGGRVRSFGRPGADYLSLWFDPERRRLHALFLRQDGRTCAGLDSFTADLRLAGTRLLPAPLQGRARLNKLCGNAASLFLIDYECRFIFELCKESLALRQVHGFFGSDVAQNYCVRGDVLLATSFYDNAVVLRSLEAGTSFRFQNRSALFPSCVDYDASRGRICLVSRADFPESYDPSGHWLNFLGCDGTWLDGCALGSLFVSAVHVMGDTGVALVLDNRGNLLLHRG